MVDCKILHFKNSREPDDVFISQVSTFRLERMAANCVWVAAYGENDTRICFMLTADEKGKLRIDAYDDTIDCKWEPFDYDGWEEAAKDDGRIE